MFLPNVFVYVVVVVPSIVFVCGSMWKKLIMINGEFIDGASNGNYVCVLFDT